MIYLHSIFKTITLIIVILYIILTLYSASQLAEKIPARIKKRVDELKLKILDDGYTLSDLAFHRFFRPDYLGELKKVNAVINDRILTGCLMRRRNLLICLGLTSIAAAAAVILYFYSAANMK